MDDESVHPAVERIVRDPDVARALDVLAGELSGSDLTSFQLELARRRVRRRRGPHVLAQYRRDRFVAPSAIDPRRLRDLELRALRAVGSAFTPIEISPVAPLGAHSTVAGVDQNRVVTTVRGSEVGADPTNTLALEAAVRRSGLLAVDRRSAEMVRLAASQRVVRAQRFSSDLSYSHFVLLGLVTAGRDVGGRTFERAASIEQIRALLDVLTVLGVDEKNVRVTDLGHRDAATLDAITTEVAGGAVHVAADPDRRDGAGYYDGICFKIDAIVNGEAVELADGGIVDWTQRLLGNAKERTMISGLSLERLAAVTDAD